MKGGDVLLFSRPTNWATLRKDFKGTIATALIHWATKSKWNHAAIAYDDTIYIEATNKGVLATHFNTANTEITVVPVKYDDAEDRLQVVAWAFAREGEKYGYLNAIMCGVNNVLVGLGFVIKSTNAIICSELVAESMERGGWDFEKDSALVSPGDLAEKVGISRT